MPGKPLSFFGPVSKELARQLVDKIVSDNRLWAQLESGLRELASGDQDPAEFCYRVQCLFEDVERDQEEGRAS